MAWLKTQKRKNPKTNRTSSYYSINWRDHQGRVRQKALGFLLIRDAERALAAFERRLQSGEFLDVGPPKSLPASSSVTLPTETRTLTEFLETTFLPRVQRDRASKTYALREGSARVLIRLIGNRPLTDIDFRRLDDFVTERSAEGVRNRTIQIDLTCLRLTLKLAVKRGELAELPKFPTVPLNDAKPHRFLNAVESRELLQAMDPKRAQPRDVTRGTPPEQRDPWSWLAVLMALNTGMRAGEILTREWTDVKWNRGKNGVLLVSHKPKIGWYVKMRRPRAVPLTRELRRALEEARDWGVSSTWIFPSPRNPKVRRKSFAKALTNGCDRAGIERISPHGLRHSWASRLAAEGAPRRSLMELGGWKSSEVLDEIYSHVTDDQLESLMDRMGIDHEEPDGLGDE